VNPRRDLKTGRYLPRPPGTLNQRQRRLVRGTEQLLRDIGKRLDRELRHMRWAERHGICGYCDCCRYLVPGPCAHTGVMPPKKRPPQARGPGGLFTSE
jgi:hypothetical protein